jgi:hypothetical protein
MKNLFKIAILLLLLTGCISSKPNGSDPRNAPSAGVHRPTAYQPGDPKVCNAVLVKDYVTDYSLKEEAALDATLAEAAHWTDYQKREAANSGSGGLRALIGNVLIGAKGEYAKKQLEEALQEFSSSKSATSRGHALVQISNHNLDNPTSRKQLDKWEACMREQRANSESHLEINQEDIDADRVSLSVRFMPLIVGEPPPTLTALVVDGGTILPATQIAVGELLPQGTSKTVFVRRANPRTTLAVVVRTDSLADKTAVIKPVPESPTREELITQLKDCRDSIDGCAGQMAACRAEVVRLKKEVEEWKTKYEKIASKTFTLGMTDDKRPTDQHWIIKTFTVNSDGAKVVNVHTEPTFLSRDGKYVPAPPWYFSGQDTIDQVYITSP